MKRSACGSREEYVATAAGRAMATRGNGTATQCASRRSPGGARTAIAQCSRPPPRAH